MFAKGLKTRKWHISQNWTRNILTMRSPLCECRKTRKRNKWLSPEAIGNSRRSTILIKGEIKSFMMCAISYAETEGYVTLRFSTSVLLFCEQIMRRFGNMLFFLVICTHYSQYIIFSRTLSFVFLVLISFFCPQRFYSHDTFYFKLSLIETNVCSATIIEHNNLSYNKNSKIIYFESAYDTWHTFIYNH